MFPTLKDEFESYLKNGKYSDLFINEFLTYVKNGIYELDSIGKEIEYLEGKRNITTTKKESQFKGKLLNGLWHKHFFCAKNVPKNCLKMFEKHGEKICRKNLSEEAFLSAILNLINKSVVDYNKTGDWIVYKKTKYGNYYLTIAKHTESDDDIHNRIQPYLTN